MAIKILFNRLKAEIRLNNTENLLLPVKGKTLSPSKKTQVRRVSRIYFQYARLGGIHGYHWVLID